MHCADWGCKDTAKRDSVEIGHGQMKGNGTRTEPKMIQNYTSFESIERVLCNQAASKT